ncbi:MAG: hypothetical protein K6E59_02545 [Bacilli bacterium]|nr:hypothetical protein [Bacilli bacterium]
MKKPVLALSALALLALASCNLINPTTSSSPAQSSSPTETSQTSVTSEPESASVAITNKEALGADWHVGDPDRTVEIEMTPRVNKAAAIADGTLKIESSNTEAVLVLGSNVHAVAAGEATITVTYLGKTDEIKLTVSAKQTNKDKYGTVHEGTLEDPFDNEDAVKVGLWAKDNGTTEELYVTGEVESFYHAPGSRDDGAVSFYLKAGTEGGTRFEVYKCFKEDGSAITEQEIWKGATIVAHGAITYYAAGNQPEFTASVLDRVTGEKPADPIDINATFAEALAAGKALSDGDSTYDYYVFSGYVVRKSGTNYFLAGTKTVEETVPETDLIELYSVSKEEDQNKLLEGAKVSVRMHLKNYHGQVENSGAPTITLEEEGQPWGIVYVEKTVNEALELAKKLGDNETSKVYYQIKGVIKAVTTAYNPQYGNISFTIAQDGQAEETLTVFRLKVSAGKAAALVEGATVEIGGQLQNYVKNENHTYEVVNGVLMAIYNDAGAKVPTYGSLEAPLSVADLLGDDGTICEQANGKFSAEQVTVKGVLVSAVFSEKYGTWTLVLADKIGGDSIKCTGVKLAPEVAATVAGNDTVVVKHFLEFYGGGYSLYYTKTGDTYNYGDILSRDKVGKSKFTIHADIEHVTIEGLEEEYVNDTKATFTVGVSEGYELVEVKVYGLIIQPTEGVYEVTVAGDGEIEVNIKEAGVIETKATITVDSLSQPASAYTDHVEATINGLAIASDNVGNYGDGLQYRVKNGKASNIYNTAATATPIKSITIRQSTSKGFVADDKELLTVSVGTEAIATPVDDDVKKGSEAESGVWTFEFTEEQAVTFFSVGHHTSNSGAIYIAAIEVEVF